MTITQETLRPRKRKQYPRYVPFDKRIDISHGDPYELFGIESLINHYDLDAQVFTINPEQLVSKLRVGDGEIPLTAAVKRRAIRLIQHDDNNLETGKVLYIIYPDLYPYSTFHVNSAPIEQIEEDWPNDVEFPEGSLVAEIMKPEARTLAVSVEAWWRERGGEPTIKFPKTGGRKLKGV